MKIKHTQHRDNWYAITRYKRYMREVAAYTITQYQPQANASEEEGLTEAFNACTRGRILTH
jgi:hypothetical protein